MVHDCMQRFDVDGKFIARYVLRLVFKEKPDKRMVHDCMQRFDVDGKFIARVCA